MKIKLFIVTYKNNLDLAANIESLLLTDYSNHQFEISIINNHPAFYLSPELEKHVTVLHNSCRLPESTGHLSRNWNQAIINGFKSVTNPDCDLLIHCQDDTIFDKDWLSQIIEYHQKYSFIQMGNGDNFCSYTMEAIKTIGLWDERFCGIGFQEADYFIRAWLYNRDKSSINDFTHARVSNTVEKIVCHRTTPADVLHPMIPSEAHKASMKYHVLNRNLFYKKWGTEPENWGNFLFKKPIGQCLMENYIFYPYFELDIPNLESKGYFVAGKNEIFK